MNDIHWLLIAAGLFLLLTVLFLVFIFEVKIDPTSKEREDNRKWALVEAKFTEGCGFKYFGIQTKIVSFMPGIDTENLTEPGELKLHYLNKGKIKTLKITSYNPQYFLDL